MGSAVSAGIHMQPFEEEASHCEDLHVFKILLSSILNTVLHGDFSWFVFIRIQGNEYINEFVTCLKCQP